MIPRISDRSASISDSATVHFSFVILLLTCVLIELVDGARRREVERTLG